MYRWLSALPTTPTAFGPAPGGALQTGRGAGPVVGKRGCESAYPPVGQDVIKPWNHEVDDVARNGCPQQSIDCESGEQEQRRPERPRPFDCTRNWACRVHVNVLPRPC